MRTSVRLFVYLIAIAAAASVAIAVEWMPSGGVPSASVRSTLGLAVLGSVAWAASHWLGKGSIGSVAFIPWLAAVLLAPTWVTVVAIGLGVAAGEASRRRQTVFLKAAFNVSQYVVACTATGVIFLGLGGVPLSISESFRPIPYLFGTLSFFLVNTAAVAAVVALSEGARFAEVWRRNTQANLVNDAISLPIVFGFAIVVNRLGLVGIVTIGALMLGLRQLYKTNAQLQITNRELLEVLVHAIELRDPYTSGHSQRVARYSRVIGRAIGLSAKQIERLSVAALLHDVGKIDQMFVPILSKPGRLTPEERAIMELHPVKSAELVAKVTELADVVAPVRHHHEAWDGSGYPDGLAGAEIPLLARVIVFADTIDAMTTDRPYRKAMSRFEVEREMLRCRGTQFDPEICDLLIASPLFEEIFKADSESTPAESMESRSMRIPSGATLVGSRS
jgi:HD-GYP domain-containing protein (c-di-GMP phosphodiesterase class II)